MRCKFLIFDQNLYESLKWHCSDAFLMWYGLGLVLWLQGVRLAAPDWLNAAVVQLSNLLYLEIPLGLALLLFWCVDRRLGGLAAFSFSFGIASFLGIKAVFAVPRPWVLDPAIHPDPGAVSSATGFSCPSGHVTGAATVYGLLAYLEWHRRGVALLALLLIALTAFTRLYLGVHSLVDVLAGCILGLLAAAAAVLLFRWMDGGEGRDRTALAVGLLVIVIALTACYLLPTGYRDGALYTDHAKNLKQICKYAGLAVGAPVGWYLERRLIGFDPTAPRKMRRFFLGAVSAAAVYLVFNLAGAAAGGAALGLLAGGLAFALYAFAGYPWLIKRYEI